MKHKGDILIIEDDVDDQRIIRDILWELQIRNELRFFERGEDAFNYLMSIRTKPFIIICDLNLKGMWGLELKKKIDGTDYLRKKAIPFVFFTTEDEDQTVNKAYQETVLQGYFKKTSTVRELKDQLKLIFDYWFAALHPKA